MNQLDLKFRGKIAINGPKLSSTQAQLLHLKNNLNLL